jgi:hypothetical protein
VSQGAPGVARGSHTETMESRQWSRGVQVQMQSSMVLISDAPSESEARCHSTQGKVFNSFPGNDAMNVSTESHPQIAGG